MDNHMVQFCKLESSTRLKIKNLGPNHEAKLMVKLLFKSILSLLPGCSYRSVCAI